MPNAPRTLHAPIISLGPTGTAVPRDRPVAALGRFWYPKPRVWPSVISATLHIAIAACLIWIVGDVLERPAAAHESVFFLPPPQQPKAATDANGRGTGSLIAFSYFAGGTTARGTTGDAASGAPAKSRTTKPVPQAATDTADAIGDNVYTSFEVDNAVQFSDGSAVPQYPPDLLARGVQGSVVVRFVVDTSGTADLQSLQIVDSSDPQFSASVRAALPRMRFSPARLNGKRVRQLVEQPFSFNVSGVAPEAGE